MAIPEPPSLGSMFTEQGDVVGAAHHGTHLETGKVIEKSGFELPPRIDPKQRMGRGVYFWENSLRAGKLWAQRHYADRSHCVLRARINLGRHMNLGIQEHQEAFRIVVAALVKESGADRVSEGQVYNFFARKGWIETARRIHKWGEQQPLAPQLQEKWAEGDSDTMICVYATARIDAPCIVWQST